MKQIIPIFLFSLFVNSLFSQSLTLDWANSIGGAYIDEVSDITQANDGGILVVGQFGDTVDFDPSPAINQQISSGEQDLFFAKYDQLGNLVFVKTFYGSSSDHCYKIITDIAGNIYIAGHTGNTVDFDPSSNNYYISPTTSQVAYFAKYDPNGNFIYVKAIECSSSGFIFDMAIDSNSDIIISGFFLGTIDFDPSSSTYSASSYSSESVYFSKYDANGSFLYARVLTDMGSLSNTSAYICTDAANNIYLTGYFHYNSDLDPGANSVTLPCVGDQDIFFAKFDANGTFLFAKNIASSGYEAIADIATDDSGNIYIAGHIFPGSNTDFDPSVADYIVSGSAGVHITFLAKYDNLGNFNYVKSFEIPPYNFAEISHIYIQNSKIYLIGGFMGQIDFDFSSGTQIYQSTNGSTDGFISQYDMAGNYISAESLEGVGTQFIYDMYIDNNGNIILAGNFQNACDFDFSSNTHNITSNGYEDIYIAKYIPSATGLKNLDYTLTSIYPNPFSDAVYFRDIPNNSTVQLISELGQPVYASTISGNGTISTSSLPPGCYIVEISSAGQTTRSKMIKY